MITVKILIFESLTTRLKRQNINWGFKITKKNTKKACIYCFLVVFWLQFIKDAFELVGRGKNNITAVIATLFNYFL